MCGECVCGGEGRRGGGVMSVVSVVGNSVCAMGQRKRKRDGGARAEEGGDGGCGV